MEAPLFCGDSTVMATGAPATVVSGVGAANLVLRDLRQPNTMRVNSLSSSSILSTYLTIDRRTRRAIGSPPKMRTWPPQNANV